MRKYSDDYTAKLKIWASDPKAQHVPSLSNLPKFGARKFSSCEEMNAWKRSLIQQLISSGGARWKK